MTREQRDDPLWLGLWCLAAVGLVITLMVMFTGHSQRTNTLVGQLFIIPMMGLGFARRVRMYGGNATEFARGLLRR